MTSALQGSLFPEEILSPRAESVSGTDLSLALQPAPFPTATPWTEALTSPHRNLRLGLCSFDDPDWSGTFFQDEEEDPLAAYARFLSQVEIDSTEYGLPDRDVLDSWVARTPENFSFSLKFPREITHERMLDQVEYLTRSFLDSASRLGPKLGPFLIQFPSHFRATRFMHLASFLEKLPTEFRYAVEVRDKGWLRDPFFELLESHKVALALVDHPYWGRLEKRTANFFYVRWLGERSETPAPYLGLQRDPATALRWWTRRLKPVLDAGFPVYGFASNAFAGHAPETLRSLSALFQEPTSSPRRFSRGFVR
jgi:uncharacterized protein YecE (DUF72 family)